MWAGHLKLDTNPHTTVHLLIACLIIVVKFKLKVFHSAFVLFSYILQQYCFNESWIFFKDVYHTKLCDPTLSGLGARSCAVG
jgi:hypothetical protein